MVDGTYVQKRAQLIKNLDILLFKYVQLLPVKTTAHTARGKYDAVRYKKVNI